MSRVRVVVSDEQKQKWTEYANETPEYDNLSDLVRKSVEHEIRTETASGGDTKYEEIYEIMEMVESVEKNQARMQDSIDAHRQQAIEKENFDEFQQLLTEALWDFAGMIREIDSDSGEVSSENRGSEEEGPDAK